MPRPPNSTSPPPSPTTPWCATANRVSLDQIQHGYRQGFSKPGEGLAATSALLALLSVPEGHYQVKLDPSALERFTVWMDTYAQRLGSFSADQEHRLEELRRACADMFTDVPRLRDHRARRAGLTPVQDWVLSTSPCDFNVSQTGTSNAAWR